MAAASTHLEAVTPKRRRVTSRMSPLPSKSFRLDDKSWFGPLTCQAPRMKTVLCPLDRGPPKNPSLGGFASGLAHTERPDRGVSSSIRRIPTQGLIWQTRSTQRTPAAKVGAHEGTELAASRARRTLSHRAGTIGVPCRPGSPSVLRLGRHGASDVQLEECESGRIGRSRKPLWSQGHRGFESHLLRSMARCRNRATEHL